MPALSPFPATVSMRDETTDRGRYAERELADGIVRIFDTTNEAAWIESDTTLSLAWQT